MPNGKLERHFLINVKNPNDPKYIKIKPEHLLKNGKRFYLTISYNYHYTIPDSEILKEPISPLATSYTLLFGGKQRGCVEIHVLNPYKIDKRLLVKDINPEIAKIVSILSEESCSIAGNLQKGHDTMLMVNTALNIIKRLFNWVIYFRFQDTSRKDCEPLKNSPSVSLSSYSIALYGKTWYEKNFKAIVENKEDRMVYKNDLKKLNNPDYKTDTEWWYFKNRYLNDNNVNINIIKECYEQSKTFREFFDRLHYLILDKKELCLTLQPWIEKFIGDITGIVDFKVNTNLMKHWIISADDIDTVEFNRPEILTISHLEYDIMKGGFINNGYKIL